MNNIEPPKPILPVMPGVTEAQMRHRQINTTWRALLPPIAIVYRETEDNANRIEAYRQLQRMAEAADLWNAYVTAHEVAAIEHAQACALTTPKEAAHG